MSGKLIKIEKNRESLDQKYWLLHLTDCCAARMRYTEMHVYYKRISVNYI
jgi:hypothetical protein